MAPRPKVPDAKTAATAVDTASPTARRELVEKQIFEHAIRLFAERGFAGTSLQDIAVAMGITRPALYYYVKSKEDLLSTLVRQETVNFADTLAALAADTSVAPELRLRKMVHDSALRQAHDPARFRILVRSESELPADVFDTYNSARKRALTAFTDVITEGVGSGCFRPVDPRVSALALIGMSNWIAWWHHPKDERTPDEIADQLADLAVASVSAGSEPSTGRTGPHHAIALLRRDLALLESMVERDE